MLVKCCTALIPEVRQKFVLSVLYPDWHKADALQYFKGKLHRQGYPNANSVAHSKLCRSYKIPLTLTAT